MKTKNIFNIKLKYCRAGHWWFTSVILATQEAELRRIPVRSQPQQKYFMRPYLKKNPIINNGWYSGSRFRP
jgi:hypothetical protein